MDSHQLAIELMKLPKMEVATQAPLGMIPTSTGVNNLPWPNIKPFIKII